MPSKTPLSFEDLIVPIPEKGRAPQRGFCIYFPRINQDWFQVPEAEQEDTIARLAEHYPSPTIQALRAALEDYVFPFQKVILVLEQGRSCVLIQDVNQTDEGEFYFEPDEFIKQFPTTDSLWKGEQTTPRDWQDDWQTHLKKARKNQRKDAPTNIASKLKKAEKAKGFG